MGLNDRRVMPWNSWKMVAKLQATETKKPILLTTLRHKGHNNFSWATFEDLAFMLSQMNVELKRSESKKEQE